jgi:threonine dehydrogenase-like Zn-dependent dehydrogenase
VQQAYEVQRRMKVWRPRVAYVLGAGQIGLLATLILKLRGLDVYCIARSKPGTLSSEIVAGLEATYVSTSETPLEALALKVGKADLIIDATGASAMSFGAMEVLGHNGVLVWTSITGGNHSIEIKSDKINIDWVLGNKLLLGSVNANREHFESGIRDLALGEVMYPGVIQRILTNPVDGLENFSEMMRLLVEEKTALKVYTNVAEE